MSECNVLYQYYTNSVKILHEYLQYIKYHDGVYALGEFN